MPIIQDLSFAARRLFSGFRSPSGTNGPAVRFVERMFNVNWPASLKPQSNFRVLVVEDEPIVGMLIEDILTEFGGFHVDVAPSVESALDVLARDWPDFAILDVNLNGIRINPVADYLKSRAIPFIFMSGYGSSALDAAYAGVKILQKPFRANDLESALEAVLSGSGLAVGSC